MCLDASILVLAQMQTTQLGHWSELARLMEKGRRPGVVSLEEFLVEMVYGVCDWQLCDPLTYLHSNW